MMRARALLSAAAIMEKLACLVAAMFVAACGSSSSNDDKGSSTSPTEPVGCAATTKSLCEHACACGSGGKCVIAYVTDGGAAITEEHDSLADCENFYSFLVCGNASTAKDYEAPGCGAAVASASCVTASSKAGVSFPPVCHASK